MPKRLLRGVIDFGDGRLTAENLQVNYNRLSTSNYEWHNPDERLIWTFVKGYHQNQHEAPSASLMVDYFERNNELTVVDKVQDIKSVEAYSRSHYATLLAQLGEEQRTNKFRKLLQEVEEVGTKGKIVDKKKVQGIEEAIALFSEGAIPLLATGDAGVTEADITTPAVMAAEEAKYFEAKTNSTAYGKLTGLEQIDAVCKGIKKGDLWVHAGFAGGLKSTFALNWAYNTATRYRGNVLYVSLEMKVEHLTKIVGVMHTTNGVFRAEGRDPLDYRKVRDGELDTPEDEAFLMRALKDLGNNEEYHRFKVWAPDRDVTIKDIRLYAENLNRQHSVDLVVIDHAGLVKSTERDPNYTVRLNAVFREAKKFALQFAKGHGVPVLLLHQINREGFKSANKAGGLFDLTALAGCSEAERSTDVVTTTYVDDSMRAVGEVQIQNLKNRDNGLFPTFKAGIIWGCRRLVTRDVGELPDMCTSDALLFDGVV